MTTKTSRRTVLAGVVALPVLSLPAVAGTDSNSDAALIALGSELRQQIDRACALRSTADHLRPRVERMVRRLEKRMPDRFPGDVWAIACETPDGKIWGAEWDRYCEYEEKVARPLANQIAHAAPRSLEGLAIVAMAIAFLENGGRNLDYALAWVLKTVFAASGIMPPDRLAEEIQEALSVDETASSSSA